MATTELEVVKISNLPETISAANTDVFPVSKSGATYKMSYETLESEIEDDISGMLDSAVAAATQSATQAATNAASSATAAAASAAEATDWAEHLTIDAVPTDGSTNPVQSNGVYDEITEIKNDLSEYENIFTGNVDESVQNWLDDHPEATTTVQDGAITYSKLNGGLLAIVFPEPINVLSLGVKNDGTEDCSSIINSATQDHELYFPAGEYRIDSPIYLEHSIFGVSAPRQFIGTTSKQGTVFKSHISGQSGVGVLNIDNLSCDIENIVVICNDEENGINVTPQYIGGAQNIRISKCIISNVSSIGILCDSLYRSSRLVYLRDCSIFGKAGSESTGIYVGNISGTGSATEPDCNITNCEIIAVQKGIHSQGGIIRIINTHIWTGKLNNDSYSESWWENTIGILCGSPTFIDACYIDTASRPIYVSTTNPVAITNLVVWDDGTGNLSETDGNYIIDFNNPSSSSFILDIATIRINSNYKGLVTNSIRYYSGIQITKVKMISDVENVPYNTYYPILGVTHFSDEIKFLVNSGKLIEVADVYTRYGGTAQIELFVDNAHCIVKWRTDYGWIVNKEHGTMRIFAKEFESGTNNRHRKLYVYNTGATNMVVQGKRETFANALMTTYGHLNDSIRSVKMPEILSSTDGLTELGVT